MIQLGSTSPVFSLVEIEEPNLAGSAAAISFPPPSFALPSKQETLAV